MLHIACEITIKLLAHPVAAAGLRGNFSDRQSALLACKRRAWTNRDAELSWFAVCARFFIGFDNAATASGVAALMLLLLLAAAAAKVMLLLLLMLSVFREWRPHDTHTA